MNPWNNLTAKQRVRILTICILPVLVVLAWIYLFPHALNKQTLVDIKYVESKGKQRVIALYQEIGNSDDGSFLTGYWLYLYDPTNNKELDKIFVKRSSNDIPQNPEMHFFGEKEIWVLGRSAFVSGDKTFTAVLEIDNDHFKAMPLDFMNGWTVQNIFSDQISFSNQYNEIGCLNLESRKISAENCESHSAFPEAPTSGFFFVKNTASSTRSHMYYYRTSVEFPPPGIFSGTVPADGTIPGWHLMDAVNMSYGSIDQSLMEAYQAKFDTSEHLVAILEKELFNVPKIVYSNDSICTIITLNDDGKTHSIYQIASNGQLIWKIPCPSIKSQSNVFTITGQYTLSQTVLIHPENWVLCIDNASGKVQWQCPK
jgi:hypothetical protein